MAPPRPQPEAPRGSLKKFLAILGPGVITGAADDDPSGIVTYSIAGAQLGTGMLWTALLSWPLMCGVQMMCARIGMVTGAGLTSAMRAKFPAWTLLVVGLALFVANAINIGADLSGMGDVMQLLTGVHGGFWVVLFGIAIIFATIYFRYGALAGIFKWLAAFLFAYVITAFLTHPDWPRVLRATFLPSWPASHAQWTTLVAILGTTISPYLFFWQASQETEESRAKGQVAIAARSDAAHRRLRDRAIDVGLGGFFSNLIMYFIMLTAATTLHRHGLTDVQSSKDVVSALEPLAGRFAALLYALGLIGVGFLAIPTLAGSAAYVFSETFGFRQGLDESLHRARAFYGILSLSILIGIALTFIHVSPVDALFLTAVINGVLAPFLLVAVLLVASDRVVMKNQVSSRLNRLVVGVTALVMFAAAAGLFLL
jgi:NRAMP (natural resistance-associated macrophage protein)-like metal ion transporter